MPVIACPKCKGKLRMPDNMEPRRVKCPNCGTVFMSSDAEEGSAQPAPPPAKPKSGMSIGAMAQSKMKGRPEERRDDEDDRPKARRRDEEEDDRPRARRRRDEDDEDDDRPRRRRRDEDDEEDDRPRARRRRDDDEEDDDRPRRRRRDDDYDDEEEDPRASRKRAAAQLARADTALLLNMIAYWLAVASLATAGLGFILISTRSMIELARILMMIGGLAGMGSFGTSAVGMAFALVGPRKNGAAGLAIATVAIMGVQLIILIVMMTDSGPGRRSAGLGVGGGDVIGNFNLTAPFISLVGLGMGAGGRAFPIPTLIYFMILLEVARFVLLALYVRSLAVTVKDRGSAGSCKTWAIAYGSVVAGTAVLGLLIGLIAQGMRDPTMGQIFLILLALVSWGGVAGTMAWMAMLTGSVKSSVRYR